MNQNKSKRVFLTGAFGSVGAQTLQHLLKQGYEVTCFDLKTKSNVKKQARLAQKYEFQTIWGDLRKQNLIQQAVEAVKPMAIAHVAAVIPPMAYTNPQLAYDVNVNGTKYLVDAAKSLGNDPKFIFISSYSVHGPRNGKKELPLLTGKTPVNPGDNYGRHKVLGEKTVKESGLPWTILRLCAVSSIDEGWGTSQDFLTFMFVIPLDQREHGGDVRDMALAITNAVGVDADGRTFNLAGDESWKFTARESRNLVFRAMGLRSLPEYAFRDPDPTIDESWYYEDWIDAFESQAILQYQEHSLEDHLNFVSRRGFSRTITQAISPLIVKVMAQRSHFKNQSALDKRSVWENVCHMFNLDQNTI